MSDVNQAYLRAYLKNRASQNAPAPSAPGAAPSAQASTDTRPTQNLNTARPTATAPRQPSVPPMQPSQNLPSGTKLRFDPSHAARKADELPQPQQARVSPRQGIWSPIGAERGMKAMESTSVPAVVRNGVTAVTSEAAQYRRPTKDTIPPKIVAPSQEKASQAAIGSAPSARVTYDQVVYVDGLAGHEPSRHASSVRQSGRTLAEIAEPIAFGTGAPAPVPHAKRTQPFSNENPQVETDVPPTSSFAAARAASPIAGRVAGPIPTLNEVPPASVPLQSNPRREASTTLNEARIASRFDPPHGKKSAEVSGLPLPVAFNPSWEVDLFFWPEVVKQIEASHPDAFRQIGKHLSLANRDGLKVMAITSGERGVGRSTVAMHMARCAAAAGLRVALLDGDTYCPSLIDQLRLDSQQGWQDCLFENIPLPEIAIRSIADRITLFPLTSVISQQQVHANLHRMAKLIRRIANAFDMVFIDANRLNLEQRDMVGVAQEIVIDAAIIVVDTELSIREKVDSAVSILQAMGISSIGLVENFQS